MKRLNYLRQRARTPFYEGETLKVDNGNWVYVKMGDTWMSESRNTLSEYKLTEVSVALRIELNRVIATVGDANIPRYQQLV